MLCKSCIGENLDRPLTTRRVDELKGVRAILAWWVVAGHYFAAFSDRFDALHNQSAVSVFIILSGFVIAALRRGKPEGYIAFMSRRAFRLIPVYALLLIISAASLGLQRDGVAHFAHQTLHNAGRLHIFDATQAHLGAQVAWHVVLLHGVVPTSLLPAIDYGILGQAWSLSVEWQFYLLAPLLIYLVTTRRWILLALVTAAIFALNWASRLHSNGAFMPHYFKWFAIGIVCYFLIENREHALARRLSWALIFGLIIYGVAKGDFGAMAWAVVFPALITKAHIFGTLSKVLQSRVLTRLGKVSYSTYLAHMLPFYFGMRALNQLRLAGPLADAALVIASLLITLGLSLGLYAMVERPGMDLGAKLARRWFADKRRPSRAIETLTGP